MRFKVAVVFLVDKQTNRVHKYSKNKCGLFMSKSCRRKTTEKNNIYEYSKKTYLPNYLPKKYFIKSSSPVTLPLFYAERLMQNYINNKGNII